MNSEAARPARSLLRRSQRGVIATHSVRFPGFPYGSAVPVATDPRGRPVILVSNLAAHTHNLRADDRASLTVHEDDVVNGSRCTIVGHAVPVAPEDAGARRYLARFPEVAGFLALGDFHFHCVEPVAVHFIGGFGDIRWFDGAGLLLPPQPIEEDEPEIVSHMNQDHVPALRRYCRSLGRPEPAEVRMATIDADGFDLLADGELLRIAFPEPAPDAAAARRHLVRMARAEDA